MRPDEVEVAVGTDREAGAVHRVVALEQEPVQLEMVPRRIGQEVHLVAERALVQVEVDRRRVATVAPEPHVPAPQLRVVLDGLDIGLARDRALEVRGDELVGTRELLVEVDVARRARWIHDAQVHCTSSRAGRSA